MRPALLLALALNDRRVERQRSRMFAPFLDWLEQADFGPVIWSPAMDRACREEDDRQITRALIDGTLASRPLPPLVS